jgi:hypothetical protein
VPLSALENTLQSWLREQLPLPEDIGDVSFDSPEGTWGTSVTRPTVNLFLFDVARAAQQPVVVAPRRDAQGVMVRDQPAPAVSFSYLLSTWGGGVREEHQLLGDAIRAVLRTPFLAGGPQQAELVGPVQLMLSAPEQVHAHDLWAGLGGRLRASLVLVATTAVTLDRPQRVAPAVQRVEAEVGRLVPKPSEPESIVLPAEEAAAAPAAGRRFVWFGASRRRERGQD